MPTSMKVELYTDINSPAIQSQYLTSTYIFTKLIPADYTVRFYAPAGWEFSSPSTQNSFVDLPATVVSGQQAVPTPENVGLFQRITLKGDLWHDKNNDGLNNDVEPMSGVNITLAGPTPKPTTSFNGSYVLSDLKPGAYNLLFARIGYNVTNLSSPVVTNLVSGNSPVIIDAGFYKAPTISGYVWQDEKTADGARGADEVAISNITVELYSTTGLSGTTTTDSNGDYTFNIASPGDYHLKFIPNSFVFSPLQNDNKANSSGKTLTITVQSGDNETG